MTVHCILDSLNLPLQWRALGFNDSDATLTSLRFLHALTWLLGLNMGRQNKPVYDSTGQGCSIISARHTRIWHLTVFLISSTASRPNWRRPTQTELKNSWLRPQRVSRWSWRTSTNTRCESPSLTISYPGVVHRWCNYGTIMERTVMTILGHLWRYWPMKITY